MLRMGAGYLQLLCHGSFIVCNVGIYLGEITIARLAENLFGCFARGVRKRNKDRNCRSQPKPNILLIILNDAVPIFRGLGSEIGYAPEIDVGRWVVRYLKFLKTKDWLMILLWGWASLAYLQRWGFMRRAGLSSDWISTGQSLTL